MREPPARGVMRHSCIASVSVSGEQVTVVCSSGRTLSTVLLWCPAPEVHDLVYTWVNHLLGLGQRVLRLVGVVKLVCLW